MNSPLGQEDISIGDAVRQDLSSIIKLLADDPLGAKRESFKDPLPDAYVEAFDAIEKDQNNWLLVARDQSKINGEANIVGVLQLTIIPNLTYIGRPRAQIEGVRVAASHRGKGLGRMLVEEAKERSRRNNCHVLQLTTDKRRPESINFYQSLGFVASHEGMKLFF